MVHNLMLEYTGTKQPKPGERDEQGRPLFPYLADEELIEAVNLAIALERPLLLRGEPGCGKTQLAWAVKYELNLPLEDWSIKSTSRAQDGLYTYDAVWRLRDAQLANQNIDPAASERAKDPKNYIRFGALGNAFCNNQRTILLIDEIDKADIDFPNDLLLELDEQRFTIQETGEEVRAQHPPIVFITSNDERELPDAFLRRCIFHYIPFPSPERLTEIINAAFYGAEESEPLLVQRAVQRFCELRQLLHQDTGKNVSTSELLDWFRALKRFPADEAIAKLNGKLPYRGVLLKKWEHHQRYLQRHPE